MIEGIMAGIAIPFAFSDGLPGFFAWVAIGYLLAGHFH
jgi:hypothetical protein